MILWWINVLCVLQYTANGFVYRKYPAPSKCKADADELWSYRGRNGPLFWGDIFPACNGKQQSPIDIVRHHVVPDFDLPKLFLENYEIPITRGRIVNNGETVQLTSTDNVARTIFVEGEYYMLERFHFHWGDSPYCGSEHKVDGVQHAMELHLVHTNRYNEVAVVAVFFQEQSWKNSELDKIIDLLPGVPYRNSSALLNSKITLENLLPSNPASYFRYHGSLTTPECTEGVTWSILTKPVPVGKHQMYEFRKLYSATKHGATKNCKLVNNFRPVQPLNGRAVYVSQ